MDGSTAQLVQAMAGFDSGRSGAGKSLNAAPLGADTSQQTFLTTPQHAWGRWFPKTRTPPESERAGSREPSWEKLIDSGFEASPDTTPEKFRRRLEADVAFWTPVVEALALKINWPPEGNFMKLPRRKFLHLAAGAAGCCAFAASGHAAAALPSSVTNPRRFMLGMAFLPRRSDH
jgi:hypothetical protein